MLTVPLEAGEIAKSWRWKQWLVLHPKKQPAILCLTARAKFRLKAWKPDPEVDVRLSRTTAKGVGSTDGIGSTEAIIGNDTLSDPDAEFVAAVVGTIR